MTTVRGKDPLKLRSAHRVEAEPYGLRVVVYVRGTDCSDNWFDAVGNLSPECAADLIRKLRRALRQVRDESQRRLDQTVTNAEGPVS